jgi:hypothetical protein
MGPPQITAASYLRQDPLVARRSSSSRPSTRTGTLFWLDPETLALIAMTTGNTDREAWEAMDAIRRNADERHVDPDHPLLVVREVDAANHLFQLA